MTRFARDLFRRACVAAHDKLRARFTESDDVGLMREINNRSLQIQNVEAARYAHLAAPQRLDEEYSEARIQCGDGYVE